MARYSNVSTNFSGGLITDHLVGRIDLDRASNSARKCTNFFPTIQGPAEYRPGFEYVQEETLDSMKDPVSASIQLNDDISYRVSFGVAKLKIFDNSGNLIDTLTTPYSENDLPDLKFSSETQKLYITHPNHRPRVLSSELEFRAFDLLDQTGVSLTSSDGLLLRAAVTTAGNQLGNWSLDEITTKIEPFLEPDTSDNTLRLEKSDEIVKITSTDSSLATVYGAADPTQFYIEYDLKGSTVLGKVITSSTSYTEVTAPTFVGGVYTVYVDAVDFISEVTAPNAKLYLLDNAETAGGSVQETQLRQDGVPDDEVHLRSDVDIFSNANVGTWIRLGSDLRSNKVVLGEDTKFDLTRWLKITEYVGLESHPINFYEGTKYIEEVSYDSNSNPIHDYTIYDTGSVYKAFGNSDFTIEDIVGDTSGEVRQDGNRVFTWSGGAFRGQVIKVYENDASGATYYTLSSHSLKIEVPIKHGISVGEIVNLAGLSAYNGDHTVDEVGIDYIQFDNTGLSHVPTGNVTITRLTHNNGDSPIIGDLTKAKSFEVVKCDPLLTVQEYDGSINSTGKLVKTTVANTTVTEVANDVFIIASDPIFDDTTSVDRHIKGVLPTGMVYAKITKYYSQKLVAAKLNNKVPRDPVTGAYENNGILEEFSLGAWYDSNYPSAVARYEQRRVYGGTNANPNFIFFSKINDEEDFAPTQDDKTVLDTDGISYGISNVNAAISWISASTDLIIGTSQGLFRLVPNQYSAAVSPRTVRIELLDEIGCDKGGVLAGTSLFFPNDSGTELLEFKFDADIQSGTTDDVAKFIYPTFVKDKIKKVEFQNNPQPRVWVLTESGLLYVMTYHRQENFYAWSKQETNGTVADITVLRKGYDSDIDQFWITVKRGSRHYQERLFSEVDSATEPTFYLDNAIKVLNFDIGAHHAVGNYLYIPATQRLEGNQFSVVVDGKYFGEHPVVELDSYVTASGYFLDGLYIQVESFTRTSGIVNVAYGLKYTGNIQPMYPTWDGQNKPAFGAETARIVSQKVFAIDSVQFKQGIDNSYDLVRLPGNTFNLTNPNIGDLVKYTGFDRERPVRNSRFGVEKLPELVQDEPYKTIFGSLVTKTDLN